MGHVVVVLELEVVKRLLEKPALRASAVFLERDERLTAAIGNRLECFQAQVSLVRADFANLETLTSFLDEWRELRHVARILVENPNGRNHIGLNAASNVSLDPYGTLTGHAVLVVIPALEFAAAESAAVDGEIGFDRPQRTSAIGNQVFQDRGERWILHHGVDLDAGDSSRQVAFLVRVQKIAVETASAESRVNLERHCENAVLGSMRTRPASRRNGEIRNAARQVE